MKTVVERHLHLAGKIVFLDGISGTGKTMMGSILSTLDRVEIQRLEHIHEYVCALHFLGRIEDDAAHLLIRMYTDLACYNLSIGREVNFRWQDLTGVPRRGELSIRYRERLSEPDGLAAVKRIRQHRPIVQIVSHQLMGVAQPLFDALGDRLRIVEMVRHPLYLIEHWASVTGWVGGDPRDFTVWRRWKNDHVPWYAHGWESQFLKSNTTDRAILCVNWLYRQADAIRDTLDPSVRRRVVVVPFERFVIDPAPVMKRIESLLGTKSTSATRRELKKQRVPRPITTAGLDLAIYRRYKARPPEAGGTEETERQRRWETVASKASAKGMRVLERLCGDYERRHGFHGEVK
jgi:hypothetical protein